MDVDDDDDRVDDVDDAKKETVTYFQLPTLESKAKLVVFTTFLSNGSQTQAFDAVLKLEDGHLIRRRYFCADSFFATIVGTLKYKSMHRSKTSISLLFMLDNQRFYPAAWFVQKLADSLVEASSVKEVNLCTALIQFFLDEVDADQRQDARVPSSG
jgi:hypothetical protein